MMLSKRFLGLILVSCVMLACQDKDANKVTDLPSFDSSQDNALTAPIPKKKPLPEPCTLVSLEDAQVVIAQPMAVMSSDAKLCAYQSAGHAGDFTSLMINLTDNEDEAMAIDVYRAIAGLSGKLNKMVNEKMGETTKKSARNLDGLGDEARLSLGNTDLIGNTTLVVRKGTVVLNFSIIGMGSDPTAAERLEALARKVVVAL
jgi:hypothetical protein